jgi:hypothetical protein
MHRDLLNQTLSSSPTLKNDRYDELNKLIKTGIRIGGASIFFNIFDFFFKKKTNEIQKKRRRYYILAKTIELDFHQRSNPNMGYISLLFQFH